MEFSFFPKIILGLKLAFGKYLFLYSVPPVKADSHCLFEGEQKVPDDCFRIDFDISRIPLRAGWYKFRLSRTAKKLIENAVLYFNYGQGFSETNKLCFSSFNSTGAALAQLGADVQGICLEIGGKEREGLDSIVFKLRPITRLEALAFYALFYLEKQRKSGISIWGAIKTKIAEMGGWRGLHLKKVMGYVNGYDAARKNLLIGDRVVSSYQSWIDRYEMPLFEKEYNRPRSRVTTLVLLDLAAPLLAAPNENGQNRKFDLEISFGNDGAAFFKGDDKKNIEVSYLSEIVGHLRELYPVDDCYIVVAEGGVTLGRYIGDAIELSIESASIKPSLIYFDSDRINDEGERYAPFFKPEWSPEFQISGGYVGRVAVFSLDYLESICEKNHCDIHDLDVKSLIFSGIARLQRSRVIRIPEIHVHEFVREKTPSNFNKCLIYLDGYIEAGGLLPELPKMPPLVSVVIPTKDHSDLLRSCIESIFRLTTYSNYELIVIDNGSSEQGALAYLKELDCMDGVTVVTHPGPFNYSAINNRAVLEAAQGEVLLFLNNDVEVISEDWIEQLVRYAIRPDIGCVGARLLYPDNTIQHAGLVLGVSGVAGHGHRLRPAGEEGYCERLLYPQEYTAVTAACMAVRRDVFDLVGGFNEKDLAVAFNDVDFCLKVWERGYRNLWTPHATLYHYESKSRGQDVGREKAARLAKEAAYVMQRWGAVLKSDPAYNPNLSLQNCDFELSTRYISEKLGAVAQQDVNPVENPYYYAPNIVRANSAVAQSGGPEYRGPERLPGLSIIILTLERFDLISQLLYELTAARPELSRTHGIECEIIVGDTGSSSREVETLYSELAEKITLVRGLKYHFSHCNNELYKYRSKFDTVLFLNNDIHFDDPVASLSHIYRTLHSDDGPGIVGPYMLYPDGTLQHGGVDIYREGVNRGLCFHPGHGTQFSPPPLGSRTRLPGVTGAFLMIKASLFECCDFFDESYEAEAQDVDLCLKARRCGFGSEVIYAGEVIHYENGTRKKGDFNLRDRSKFVRKWRLFEEILLDE